MKTFAVRLEGTGINLLTQDGSEPAIGFFTTRWVKAVSDASAKELAKASVLSEWTDAGQYVAANEGEPPTLVVEAVWTIGFLRATFARKPDGYTFYTSL
ncbi:hypothetical protein [Marilutibacter maris]|uniref:hypothetical protein n=1 Tax=Marilutibacter maris TaxID=1605891 RepID=UPI0011AE7617|nr:hypothetical protein [Lysobacter maris]